MDGVRRALPAAPGDWRRLSSSVVLGLAAAGGSTPDPGAEVALAAAERLESALAPVRRATPRGGLSPTLVFVTVRASDVARLGAAARLLGASLLPTGPGPAGSSPVLDRAGTRAAVSALVWDMALVHGLLDLDPGADAEILRYWGADGPTLVAPPPVALAAHRRLAARVYTLWTAGLR